MGDDIPLLPAIPERLRVAARQGTLVPFVGAGVSQLAGCPGWEEFANGALQYFVSRGLLTHGQFDQLSKLPTRVKLSVAEGLEKQHHVSIDFRELLASRPSAKRAGEQVYAALSMLAKTFITTNYDEWLDLQPAVPVPRVTPGQPQTTAPTQRRVLYRPEEFDGLSLTTPDTVIHIHGSVRDRSTMVFTTAQYLQRYAGHRIDRTTPEENPYLTFLQFLFRHRTVLFIGYSLGELEILEYVVQKAREARPARSEGDLALAEPQHYLLQGFFAHEIHLKRSLQDYYYRECGIGLLPYSRETQGWSQLIDVLEYLVREVPAGPVLPLQQRLEMEDLLK